jgi:hypothetical protein
MSKFKIYRINTADPKDSVRQNKRLYTGYSVLLILTYFVFYSDLPKKWINLNGVIYYIIIAVLIISTLFVGFRAWRQIHQLKKIGTLEFTQTTIRKEISDLKTEFRLDNILRIEAEEHFKALTVFQSNTGSVTYIIRIIKKDLQEDQLVVSEKSVDFGEKLSIINTLNTIKKIANIEVKINKTDKL